MKYANIHTHTTFSDGKNSPEEVIEKAIALGFSSIGISDHSETAFDSGYCMAFSKYESYRKTIGELKRRYSDQIDVLCGIEQDSYSPSFCEGFDYVIGSVHYILYENEHLPIDASLARQTDAIERFFGGDKLEYARRYYDVVANNALSRKFDVLGHFDLLNKFGLYDDCTDAYQKIALEALDAVFERVPFIEMNTGAISRGYKAVYPDAFILRRILDRGGKIVLNSDSHSASTLDCHFAESLAKLKEIGFSSVWQLSKNGWNEIGIK